MAGILVLERFLAGIYTQLRQAVLRRGGDVVVAQAGVTNFLATRSILPQRTPAAVEALPGVGSTHPLAALGTIHERGEHRSPIIILVYDDAGGPIGNLDTKSGLQVVMILHDVARGQSCSVLIVTHDQRIEEVADRVLRQEHDALRDRKTEIGDRVRDPVRNMAIDVWTSIIFADHGGTRFHFCSDR